MGLVMAAMGVEFIAMDSSSFSRSLARADPLGQDAPFPRSKTP
jgi:hypothetical protein